MYRRILICALACGILCSCARAPKRKPPTFSEDVQPPTLLERVEPFYPQEARQKGFEGGVNFYLLVSEEGEVKQAKVTKSSGHDILDDAALEYGKNLKFEPALREGKPTSVWLTWTINYNLEPLAPCFAPKVYVQKIEDLFELADQSTAKERDRILLISSLTIRFSTR